VNRAYADDEVGTLVQSVDSERRVRLLVERSFGRYGSDSSLRLPDAQVIRAGRRGGLPFDVLTTDLVRGCLPATQICYGNCFAARAAFEAGFDFGTRVTNILDEQVLRDDLDALPGELGYVRNGWNSDPSWDWPMAQRFAAIVAASGRHAVFITKCFKAPDETTTEGLVRARAEFRVSVSAFDTPSQLRQRLRVAHRYREHGGIAVPVVMTARFTDPALTAKQDRIVAYCEARDFPTAENALRFTPQSPVLDLIDLGACGRVASTGDFWSGRLFTHLRVPTVTSVPVGYRGLESPYLSGNSAALLDSLWFDPVRTHAEVMSQGPVDKPKMCGVPMVWLDPASPPVVAGV
jgi:hypothetical protein